MFESKFSRKNYFFGSAPLEILFRKISGKFFCFKSKGFSSKPAFSLNQTSKPSKAKFLTGFTLIELLIVIGILAVLSVTAVIVINPAQIVARANDAKRLTELASLNQALQIAEVQGIASFGSLTAVYVSIPDTSPVCANLGLPALPAGWSYGCKPQADYKKINGDGWVPVNFASILGGSPLSVLPVDPVNSTSSGLYYAYAAGGSWKLTALMESEKQAKVMAKDGGPDVGIYETGSNLNLANFQRGLAGYWKMDGGVSGAIANNQTAGLGDSSGNNNNGTAGNLNGTGMAWAAGKASGAVNFDGTDDYVNAGNGASLNLISFTAEAWVKTVVSSGYMRVLSKDNVLEGGTRIAWTLKTTNNDGIKYVNLKDVSGNFFAKYPQDR